MQSDSKSPTFGEVAPVSFAIGMLLTPVASALGVLGFLVLGEFVWGASSPSSILSSRTFGNLVFASSYGIMFAWPVTIFVLPLARSFWRRRGPISFLSVSVVGLLSGAVAPGFLIVCFYLMSGNGLHGIFGTSELLGVFGAIGGLLTAILFFLLTNPIFRRLAPA